MVKRTNLLVAHHLLLSSQYSGIIILKEKVSHSIKIFLEINYSTTVS